MKQVPLRKCIACKEMLPKQDLIKVVKNKNDEFSVDLTGKMEGRGAYICKKPECTDKLFKNRLLHKAFSKNVPDTIYNDIKQILVKKD
ncbi:MAG: RNase P modulator RnpM [Spirochaetales bacterium]